jgi:serine/threonine-protein kinase
MGAVDEGTVIAGKYRLDRPLGRGGMGAVWRARHLGLDKEVAVKLPIPAETESDGWRARFQREARAAGQIQSPHVVQVHDYGVDGDQPYLVLELLEGEDLGARLKREGRLAPAEAARIVGAICKGLRAAHEAGLVHRDLKPQNVFLARVGGDEVVKILDFGIAKAPSTAAAPGDTETGISLGTPHYMSPEQARDSKRVDARSDLWSLGVIAFRCLTGVLPFDGDEVGAVLLAICMDPIPRASEVAPHLGPAADRFFARALARDVAQRFQSASELAAAFEALAGELSSSPGVPPDRTVRMGGAAVPAASWSSAATAPGTPTPPVAGAGGWRRAYGPWGLAGTGLVVLALVPALPPAGVPLAACAAVSAVLMAAMVRARPESRGRRVLPAIAAVVATCGAAGTLLDVLPEGAALAHDVVGVATALGVLLSATLAARPGSSAARKVRVGIVVVGAFVLVSLLAHGVRRGHAGTDGSDPSPARSASVAPAEGSP